jgi:hypothetical protein
MPSGRRWRSGSRSASATGWSGSRGAPSSACSRSGRPPEWCVEAYYLPTANPVEGIAKRKLCRRQLTEDGNVEINGRDLPEGSPTSAPSA